jgi:hypothetical protein
MATSPLIVQTVGKIQQCTHQAAFFVPQPERAECVMTLFSALCKNDARSAEAGMYLSQGAVLWPIKLVVATWQPILFHLLAQISFSELNFFRHHVDTWTRTMTTGHTKMNIELAFDLAYENSFDSGGRWAGEPGPEFARPSHRHLSVTGHHRDGPGVVAPPVPRLSPLPGRSGAAAASGNR